jgi:hypothetical protein
MSWDEPVTAGSKDSSNRAERAVNPTVYDAILDSPQESSSVQMRFDACSASASDPRKMPQTSNPSEAFSESIVQRLARMTRIKVYRQSEFMMHRFGDRYG